MITHQNNTNRVYIFDTTLRDGEQCPGAQLEAPLRLEYARIAHGLGVDILEAGFPAASRADFLSVEAIAQELACQPDSPVIAGLCQLRREQIETTIKALSPAVRYKNARLHTYLPVDPDLMEASLGARANKKNLLLQDVADFVALAVEAGLEVEFSPEGYSKQGENFEFVTDVIRAAVNAGATIINCPDTIGGHARFMGESYFVKLMKRHAAIIANEFPTKKIIWSAHCHNDFGLAAANSVEAVFNGPARQIEGTINGVGERAGNASLEQIIMLIKHFGGYVNIGNPFFTQVKAERLQSISDFVARHMLPRQPHSPITGANAARHTSGGHTNAVLKNPLVYQPFDPKEVGGKITLVFSPLSGGNHAQVIIREAGYECDDGEKHEVAQFIKSRNEAERRKGITDDEVVRAYREYRFPIVPTEFGYSKRGKTSTVELVGKFFDSQTGVTHSVTGADSAIAALVAAIVEKYPDLKFDNYRAEAGNPAQGVHAESITTITVHDGPASFTGRGQDKDIEISAMKAVIDAVNQAFVEKHYRLKGKSGE